MLTMLLDDILNASAMDKGEYRITYENGEKNFMCESAISSAEHRLQPGVKMYYDPEDPAPFTFRTDPRRVQQILINLLTNSCKHTAKGEIRLSSSLTENPGYVTFSVTDTGTGVPPEQAEKIFERFTKLDEFVQGTGLGLSICKAIADGFHGQIGVESEGDGCGSTFWIKVPCEIIKCES
jgi:signal transduction histidine kinase